MKKLLLGFLGCICIVFTSQAQVYEGAVGLGLDFGDGETLVGPSGKYFFAEHHAGQLDILFGDGLTGINIFYQYHGLFSGSDNLQWFAGIGPTILLGRNDTSDVGLRPMIGLDLKIREVPLAFTMGWQPYLSLDDGGTEIARFGLGFRYVIN